MFGDRHSEKTARASFRVHLARRDAVFFPLIVKGCDLFRDKALEAGTEGEMVVVVEGTFHASILPLRPASCIGNELSRRKSA